MLSHSLRFLEQTPQRLYTQCVRASNSSWSTSLREAFMRVFPLLLLMNGCQAIALCLPEYTQAQSQLLGIASYVSSCMGFVFLLYALHAVAISYTLDRFSLYSSGLLGYGALLVRSGEVAYLSFGSILFTLACSTFLAVQLESYYSRQQKPSTNSSTLARWCTAILCVSISVFLVQITVVELVAVWMEELNLALQQSMSTGHHSSFWVNGVYLLAVFSRAVLGFMGFHGHNALYGIFESLYAADTHIRTVDLVFTSPGGNGATLCLLFAAVYLWLKGRKLKQHECQALPFAIFNINDVLLYGYPLVWNPMFLMPFIVVPLLGACFGITAAAIGLIDNPEGLQSWMFPAVLQPYYISTHWLLLSGVLAGFFMIGSALYGRALLSIGIENSSPLADTPAVQRATLLGSRNGETIKATLDVIKAQSTVARWMRAETIVFAYQPIVGRHGEVLAVEVLLRLRDGDGIKGPLDILQACELLDLEAELDRFVLSRSTQQAAALATEFPQLQVAVNITPAFTRCDDFPEQVEKAVATFPLPLVLELTEGTPVDDMAVLCNTFSALQSQGKLLIAIDDYGSGYSSLSYLQTIVGDKLKLDQSLMVGLENARGREVVRATVELAHRLDFIVVAEGIETIEQFKILLDMGVDTFQGFYFSKPLLFDDLVPYLRRAASEARVADLKTGTA